jgi:hypothetical protein
LPPPHSTGIFQRSFSFQENSTAMRIGIAQTVNERYMFALRSARPYGKFLDFRVFAGK